MRKKTIHGKDHVLVVLKVEERDQLGRPMRVTVGYDDTVFKLDGGEEFFTAWAPVLMAEVETKGQA